MKRAAFICQIGCMEECAHELPCMIYMIDAEHPHPVRHIGYDPDTRLLHEWRSDGTRRRCIVTKTTS